MNNGEVALVGCDSYDRELVEEKVSEAIELLGGPGEMVGKGSRVFIKVNALRASEPASCVTTHPEVVRALVRTLQPVTRDIVIGDSPGGPYGRTFLKRILDKAGFSGVAEDTGVEINYDTSVSRVTVPLANRVKSIALCGAMVDADHLISVSKYKTHLLVNVTGTIKNLFGAVPGIAKFTYHSRFSRPNDFADLLVDVLLAADPDFHLVDAIQGMDGNGPSQGEVKKMGVIAAGRDALTVDAVMMNLIGHDMDKNLALNSAMARGLCPDKLSEIALLGESIEALSVDGFRMPMKKDITTLVPEFLMKRFGNLVSVRPQILPEKCTGCRKCSDICPQEAISIESGTARINYRSCIKCYCCHELCDYDAVSLRRPLLMKVAGIR